MSGDNDSTTGNLLDYLYYHKHYKPIGIDLSRQKNKVFLKKQFYRKIRKDDVATCFLLLKSSKKLF